MRRVLIFVPGLPMGGAERHSIDLRHRLRERGYHVDLLVFGPRRSPAILAMEGVDPFMAIGAGGMSKPGGWVRVHRALRESRPSVILAVNQTPLIVSVVSRAIRATRARIACVFHTTLLRESEEQRLGMFRGALRHADAIVYVSDNQRRIWEGRNLQAMKTEVILNGIDLGRFSANAAERSTNRSRLGYADDDFVVGAVAALRPEKNHVQIIDAVAELRKRGVPARGLLVGDGPMREAIVQRCRQHGLEGQITLAGEQDDVRPWVAACDVGVLPSVAVETFSLSAIEFLASGVPMVMSDIGGASEIVTAGRNGFLFPPGDTPQLVDRLFEVSVHELRRSLAEHARPSVSHLAVDRMVDQYEHLLGTL
ncbi:hypothetical protein GCM10007887_23970 [Methylobacterium haplocladii]|nr:hypothetical protein GCM10007887_23970 [Methylobacterium haplocladii]